MSPIQPSDGFFFNGIHPLLIPGIVKNVAGFLEPSSIKSFRAVCSEWKDAAYEVMRSTEKIVLADDNSITKYMQHFPPDAAAKCHSDYTFYNSDLSSKLLEEFLFLYGSHMKTISFQQKQILEENLYRILENYTPNVESINLRAFPTGRYATEVYAGLYPLTVHPKIQKLVVDNSQVLPTFTNPQNGDALVRSVQNMRDSMVRLLKRLPNIQRLKLSRLDAENRSGFPVFVEFILRCLIAAGPTYLLSLTHLEFPMEQMTEDRLTGLTSLKLSVLQYLDIHLDPSVHGGLLNQFLHQARDTLAELTISYPENSYLTFIPDGLRNLRVLILARFERSLGFLRGLQLLKSLTLIHTNVAAILPVQARPLVAELEIFKVVSVFREGLLDNPEIMTRITRLFPNLKSLHAPGVGDAGLQTIYLDLPLLEELKIQSGTFTDEGITGLPDYISVDLLETSQYGFDLVDRVRCGLFIGNLLGLRTLSLESGQMTVKSVIFGMMRCTNLRYLTLESPQINDESIERMRILSRLEGRRLDMLDLRGCPEVTQAGTSTADHIGPAAHPSEEELTQTRHTELTSRGNEFRYKYPLPKIGNEVRNLQVVLELFRDLLPEERIIDIDSYIHQYSKYAQMEF